MPRNIFVLLVIIIVLVCGSWSGYWFFRGYLQENVVMAFLEQEDEDWEFEYSDISLRGFPNRTDLIIHDLKMLNQKDESFVDLGDLEVLSLVYNWNDFILSFAPVQKAMINEVAYEINSENPRLSLKLNREALIILDSLIVELNKTSIFSSEEMTLDLDAGLFAFKTDETDPETFLIHLRTDNIKWGNARDQIFFQPFDFVGNGIVSLAPETTSHCYIIDEITFSSVKFDFEDFGVSLTGEFSNQNGLPDGSLAIELVGEKEKFFDLLVANGLISSLQFFVAANLPIDSYVFQISQGKVNLLNLVTMDFSYSFPEFC